jgi:transcriptional regulator with XRE-family HTH domain
MRQVLIDTKANKDYCRTMKALIEYLHISGITQAELARRVGITPVELNRFIQGKREPRVKNLRKIAKATGISIEKLIESVT